MASGSRSTNTSDLAGGGVGLGSDGGGGGKDGSAGATEAAGTGAVDAGGADGVCPRATAMAKNNISVRFRINTSLSIGRESTLWFNRMNHNSARAPACQGG